jgi:hypothetical protein
MPFLWGRIRRFSSSEIQTPGVDPSRHVKEKFGGDSPSEMERNVEGYREQLRGY